MRAAVEGVMKPAKMNGRKTKAEKWPLLDG
jgi:hypothetical protein